MTKLSKRLKAIADFVECNDSVIDVGCDHGLLSIYLVENKIAKKVVASDINQKALNNAITNIKKKKLNIKTFLSDGIRNVNMNNINTVIISGVGTKTVLHILDDSEKLKRVNKIIIQSNNDYDILRKEINSIGYYLEDEVYTLDRRKWYVTCKFIKSEKKNNKKEIKYGLLNNEEYNEYLIEKRKKIYKKIPYYSIKAKILEYIKLRKLKKAIR